MSDRCGRNLLRYWLIPSNLWMPVLSVGAGISRTASTLAGSTLSPSADANVRWRPLQSASTSVSHCSALVHVLHSAVGKQSVSGRGNVLLPRCWCRDLQLQNCPQQLPLRLAPQSLPAFFAGIPLELIWFQRASFSNGISQTVYWRWSKTKIPHPRSRARTHFWHLT